jgi:hypothetical protein
MATTYTAYQVANYLIDLHDLHHLDWADLDVADERRVPKAILSAILRLTAERRQVGDMETLIVMGANPHEVYLGDSVLERFLLGSGAYARHPSETARVECGVKMLAEAGVSSADFKNKRILNDCKDIIKNSEYLRDFLGVEPPRVKFYWHAPLAEEFQNDNTGIFTNMEVALKSLPVLTPLDQYIAVLEFKGKVTRYLVTKKAGPLEIIPMEREPGWSKDQQKVSNIVNFVMGNTDYPLLPFEDEDEE